MTDYKQYYERSIQSLTEYIKNNKAIPTEKIWNQTAYYYNYLTSQSLGYLSGLKFPDLCKKIYKQIRKEK